MKRPVSLKLLDCSTGHLSLATRELLDGTAAAGDLGIMSREEGYFISAGIGEGGRTIPEDLAFVARFATLNGFDYILFDRDADPIDILPWYGDENQPLAKSAQSPAFPFRSEPVRIGGAAVRVVSSAAVLDEQLILPVPESTLEEGDYILKDGSAWFTLDCASVRLAMIHDDNGEQVVRAEILPLGMEMEEPFDVAQVLVADLKAAREPLRGEVPDPPAM